MGRGGRQGGAAGGVERAGGVRERGQGSRDRRVPLLPPPPRRHSRDCDDPPRRQPSPVPRGNGCGRPARRRRHGLHAQQRCHVRRLLAALRPLRRRKRDRADLGRAGQQDRPQARQERSAGCPPLAGAARHPRHPKEQGPGAPPRKYRPLFVGSRRGRHGSTLCRDQAGRVGRHQSGRRAGQRRLQCRIADPARAPRSFGESSGDAAPRGAGPEPDHCSTSLEARDATVRSLTQTTTLGLEYGRGVGKITHVAGGQALHSRGRR
mmetsp:Transcript_5676/g.16111  ORF Transcript_5676/g.16111 Transcript_5676/m.16111 type:complete len:264 (-) Transcript_5676:1117-1908(-)